MASLTVTGCQLLHFSSAPIHWMSSANAPLTILIWEFYLYLFILSGVLMWSRIGSCCSRFITFHYVFCYFEVLIRIQVFCEIKHQMCVLLVPKTYCLH